MHNQKMRLCHDLQTVLCVKFSSYTSGILQVKNDGYIGTIAK